ncbi:hypothetical protein GE09DRAFT_766071 [Coniochaeta sp. 2T2.1]|nr:hypothetical protein GE09DRAFT_766071 [Coniochaeta sp. 2T2.1]
MDKTKEAVKNFMSKSGHHDTTVHEQVAPAVKHETIKPKQHEEIVTAVDKEVHQDHYHRQVQPVHDREVLPEQHKHNVGGVVNREFDHRNNNEVERALKAEESKLRDERVVQETQRTQTRAPVVEGEHVHHHVHETIQPVIQKEVIQPEVVHTTVPVHEVHHKSAEIHGTTTLPPVSINEFQKQGGVLSGHHERTSHFDGCPEGVHHNGCPEGSHPNHQSSRTTGATGTGTGIGNNQSSTTSSTSHHVTGEGREGSGRGLGGSVPGQTGHTSHNATGTTTGTHNTTDTATGTHGTTDTHKKPSLLDRLNPMKDADHDGKKGMMD